MERTICVLVAIAALGGCKDGKEKMKEAAKDVDHAIDKLDLDEAKQHLANAKDAIAKGLDAVEDCTWATSVADNVVDNPVVELRRLCSFDAPLGRATRAVEAAEKARAEQAGAPTLTECQSDSWAKAARDLDAKFASEPKWLELKARWTKVCPSP